ncbi:MAG: chromosome condensation regulator, partial [Clostridiales bacterium]|nr:chromosome condensation regulator [Clostridiales bacterium]
RQPTLGLRADGTVAAAGENRFGQSSVHAWTNIVAVAAGDNHTVGLRSDGTMVAVGSNQFGQCNVTG